MNTLGQISKRSLAGLLPRSKSFSICPTILSQHYLLYTVLWKHIEKTWKAFIFLKQPTKEDWFLEVQRFFNRDLS